jgi:hypothetical protein
MKVLEMLRFARFASQCSTELAKTKIVLQVHTSSIRDKSTHESSNPNINYVELLYVTTIAGQD